MCKDVRTYAAHGTARSEGVFVSRQMLSSESWVTVDRGVTSRRNVSLKRQLTAYVGECNDSATDGNAGG
jgi:hypothetical protein